ncbi:MAG: GGDEF domain-containing protein [Oligoflexales bacterium]
MAKVPFFTKPTVVYGLFGAFAGLIIPIGWTLISPFVSEVEGQDSALFVYLWLSSTLVLYAFGYYVNLVQQKLQKSGDLDPLTGLLTHSAFSRQVTVLWELARRREEPVAAVVINIDNFKQINESQGHIYGDFVISEVAEVLKNTLRKCDVIARFGGDEYVVFLHGSDQESAQSASERILKEIRNRTITHLDISVQVTVSIGIAVGYPSTTKQSDLMEQAAKSVYASKRSGRDRFTLLTAA